MYTSSESGSGQIANELRFCGHFCVALSLGIFTAADMDLMLFPYSHALFGEVREVSREEHMHGAVTLQVPSSSAQADLTLLRAKKPLGGWGRSPPQHSRTSQTKCVSSLATVVASRVYDSRLSSIGVVTYAVRRFGKQCQPSCPSWQILLHPWCFKECGETVNTNDTIVRGGKDFPRLFSALLVL